MINFSYLRYFVNSLDLFLKILLDSLIISCKIDLLYEDIDMSLEFTYIAAWAYPETPSVNALFETIALLKLEGKRIRLSADDQRKIIGFNVFGKQNLEVNADGTIRVSRKISFGMDYEASTYSAAEIKKAVELKKVIMVGMTGEKYFCG